MHAVVIGSLQAPLTGSKIRGRSLAAALARAGWRTTYLEPTDPRSDEAVALDGVEVVRTPYPSWPAQAGLARATAANLMALRRCRDARLVLALKPLPSSCVPLLAGSPAGAVTIIDVDDLEASYWAHRPALAGLLDRFERGACRRARLLTVHNEPLRAYATSSLGRDPGDVLWLPQGVDPERYAGVRPSAEFAAPGRRLVGYSAFLGVAAELERVVDAVAAVAPNHPGAHLLVIGDGPRLEEYRSLCAARGVPASFAGYRPHADALALMASCDVLMNPMRDNEANRYRSSIKLREYLMLGRPVVATAVGDAPLFADHARLVADDPAALAAALAASLSAPHDGAAGRDFVAGRYSWDRIVRTFLDELGHVVELS